MNAVPVVLDSVLRAALIEASNLLAAAAPPGMRVALRVEDNSTRFAGLSQSTVLPGRVDILVSLESMEGNSELSADARVVDQDGDGTLDDVILLSMTRNFFRP